MQLVNIGFGNLVSVGRLIAVVSPDSLNSLNAFAMLELNVFEKRVYMR